MTVLPEPGESSQRWELRASATYHLVLPIAASSAYSWRHPFARLYSWSRSDPPHPPHARSFLSSVALGRKRLTKGAGSLSPCTQGVLPILSDTTPSLNAAECVASLILCAEASLLGDTLSYPPHAYQRRRRSRSASCSVVGR